MMIWDNTSWDEELTKRVHKPQPELPEDVLVEMLRRHPQLEKLINRFNLELEY